MIVNPMIIKNGGGSSPSGPLDPVEVYNNTRPADWLTMPTPADNEMFLLFHIPAGVSSLLAFTVTCTGNYTVALGTVNNGSFVQSSSTSIASGSKYEAELFADDYADFTSNGMKQVMVKVSGTDILTWQPSMHSKKTSPSKFCSWNIVDISCKLPSGNKVQCGNSSYYSALLSLMFFSWYGPNNLKNTNSMFQNCYSLTSIPSLDTSGVTMMMDTFNGCRSLISIPSLDTSRVTNMQNTFYNCYSLTSIPSLDTSKVTSLYFTFSGCCSLTSIPSLDTSRVTTMSSTFNGCYSLTLIPVLDTSKNPGMSVTFSNCYSLSRILFVPTVSGISGYALGFKDCSLGHTAIVELFNSLPTITSAKAITLTGNPGVSELTDAEKAIATGKGWTLTL